MKPITSIDLLKYLKKNRIHSVTIATANTDTDVPHYLNRKAAGYVVVSAPGYVYKDASATWTNEKIIIRCSATGGVKLLIF